MATGYVPRFAASESWPFLRVWQSMNTYNIEGAAAFLNISTDTMKDLAGNGTVAGAKIGKAWVFAEEDLVEYLRSEIKKQTAARRGDKPEKKAQVPTAYARSVRHRPMLPPPLSLLR